MTGVPQALCSEASERMCHGYSSDVTFTTFVTGAAGFIGSNFVDRSLHNGELVVGYDNLSTGLPEFIPSSSRHRNSPLFIEIFSLPQPDGGDAWRKSRRPHCSECRRALRPVPRTQKP